MFIELYIDGILIYSNYEFTKKQAYRKFKQLKKRWFKETFNHVRIVLGV